MCFRLAGPLQLLDYRKLQGQSLQAWLLLRATRIVVTSTVVQL